MAANVEEKDEFATPPQAASEAPVTDGIDKLNLGDAAAQRNGVPLIGKQEVVNSGVSHDTGVNGIQRIETTTADLNLPLSSKDGSVVKTPLGKPLGTSKPTPRAAYTPEQLKKYDDLLSKVSAWTEIKGTPVQDHERMFCTRECLFRYLRATSWKVDQAETRLKNTLIWRREYGTDTKLTSEYISIENETGKQVILGWDNEGRPCQYLRPSKQNTERSDRQIEHLVYMLERTIDLMPPGQEMLALLINFAETKKGQGATLKQGQQTLNILQNHYPERLGRALVANVPWVIWGFFKLITPFIDPVTKEKIRFNEDYGIHVPRDQLMQEAGGEVQFDYDHQSYWPALTKLTEMKRVAYRKRWEAAGKRIGEYETYLKGGEQRPLVEIEKEQK